MSQPDGKNGRGKGASKPDREALREAFAGVKPLRSKSPKRVRKPAEPAPAGASAKRPPADEEPLQVVRESNGIVLGARPGVHRSILDALEDPD